MEMRILVSDEVIDIIRADGVCYAENKKPFSTYAYEFMKEITGFKGLFFAIYESEEMKQNPERMQELIAMSSEQNRWELLLDVPEHEVFMHDYYDFTDLIYFYEEADYQTVNIIKEAVKVKHFAADTQCLLNRIEKNWIVAIEIPLVTTK
jgi:hypothetical protein